MIKRFCVICLSICIAAGMVLGVISSNPIRNNQDAVTICDMSAIEVSC